MADITPNHLDLAQQSGNPVVGRLDLLPIAAAVASAAAAVPVAVQSIYLYESGGVRYLRYVLTNSTDSGNVIEISNIPPIYPKTDGFYLVGVNSGTIGCVNLGNPGDGVYNIQISSGIPTLVADANP